jgi:pSer/pThr/pTyr-binding forkhead associated (FHA) protein
MKLIIEDDEGRKTVVPIVREEITIGRQDGNTIRLTERNVSRRHARLLKDNGSLLIEDLGSYNGVRVNGDRIAGPTRIKEGDLIEIGDYDLGIQGKLEMSASPAAAPAPAPKKEPAPKPAAAKPAPVPAAPAPAASPEATAPIAAVSAPEAAAPHPAAAVQQPMPSASAGGATAIIRVSDIMKNAPQVEVRDLQKNEMPRLVGLAGTVRGKELYLMRSEVKFGRTEDNDLSIDHQSVSRQHCRFVLDQGTWKVMDNKSANGVRVNGEEYAISAVKSGDTLELGHLKFRFVAPGEKFTVPPEKTEESAKAAGGLKPTTAELIAGASSKGSAPSAADKSKAGPPIGLIAGIVGVVIVLAAVAFFVLRGGRKEESGEEAAMAGGNLSAAEATRQADAAFKKHEYSKAFELYEQAVAKGANPPNRKRAGDEAKGEESYRELESAIASGNFDKARTLSEKCSTETTFWCGKAAEKADAIKAGYGKAHLAKATAAKAGGKLDVCTSEANLVLAFDPGSADAQALAAQCQPTEAASAKEPVAKKEGPSQKERDQKAAALLQDANAKLTARDFQTVVQKCQAAMALHPSDRTTQGGLYRNLGYAYAFLGDAGNAKKFLKLYLPYSSTDKAQVENFIATH